MKDIIANAGPATCISGAALPEGLASLLRVRNGFYAYGGALHVFGSGEALTAEEPSIEQWNARADGWVKSFSHLAGHVVFAEDLFGSPFSVDQRGRVFRTDPEVAQCVPYGRDVFEWARSIETDPAVEVGSELRAAWQRQVRPLSPNERLIPMTPFVLGGEYEVDNLMAVGSDVALREYVRLARVLGSVPDGQKVSVDFWLAGIPAVPPARAP